MLLAEVRQAQTRIDDLLGLALSAPDALSTLISFRALVIKTIGAEAPELAPRLAAKLLSGTDQ